MTDGSSPSVSITDHGQFDMRSIVAKPNRFVDTRHAAKGLAQFRHKIVKLGAPSALVDALQLEGEVA